MAYSQLYEDVMSVRLYATDSNIHHKPIRSLNLFVSLIYQFQLNRYDLYFYVPF